MDKTLTIPKNRIGSSLAVAGIGSLVCATSSYAGPGSFQQEASRSTGSNVAWCRDFLSGHAMPQTEDPYVSGIQRLRSLTPEEPNAAILRSDRDALLECKHVLSLTASQLAQAMGVSRSALYQWIDESNTMRPKSRERLEVLRRLSDYWSEKIGVPVSRCAWVDGANQARLAGLLAAKSPNGIEEARTLLDELERLKPVAKASHRSILEIAKERNWKKLPEHIRQAERSSRIPTARITPDPS